jgi:hypothetical protein
VYVRAPQGLLRRMSSWEQLELPLPTQTKEAFLSGLEAQIERVAAAPRERATAG